MVTSISAPASTPEGSTPEGSTPGSAPGSTGEGFAAAVLRGLVVLGPVAETDLALELALSAWMRFNDVDSDGARRALLTARRILLGVGKLDPVTEPIPFSGRSPRLDTLNLAAYLGTLIERAAASAHCRPDALVEQAIGQLPVDGRRSDGSHPRRAGQTFGGRAG